MRFFLVVISFCLIDVGASQAQDNIPPIEAYGQRPSIVDMELSPDGETISSIQRLQDGEYFIVTDREGNELVKMGADAAKAGDIRYLANETSSLRIGHTITKGYRNNFEAGYRLAANLDTKTGSVLLRGWRELGQARLDYVVATYERTALMPAYDRVGRTSPQLNLYAVDMINGKATRFSRGNKNTINWIASPDQGIVLREDADDARTWKRLYIVNGEDENLLFESNGQVLVLGLEARKPSLLTIQHYADDEFPSLVKMQLETGESVVTSLDGNVETVIRNKHQQILGLQLSGLKPRYFMFDSTLQKTIDTFSQRYPSASVYFETATEDMSEILFKIEGREESGKYVIMDTNSGLVKPAGAVRQQIKAQHVADIKVLDFQARDGLNMQALITKPLRADALTAPILMMPHGGPAAYDRIGFDWQAQYFASRGYLVIQPNFRGSSGYGVSFEAAGSGEWGGAMQNDLEDALMAAKKQGMAGDNQACIIGASYGGYAALAGGAFQNELWSCVVAIAPVSDLNRMMKNERRDHGRNHWVVSYWDRIISRGNRDKNFLKEISPLNHAQAFQQPILILHGEDDTVVPPRQGQIMARALRRAKKQVEFHKIDNADHWLLDGEARLEVLKRVNTFLEKHLPVE